MEDNIEILEKEAKATALKHVATMLQRSDQLEKVDQYKKRTSRKKASVEAMLKTALQSQLDGVRTGLKELNDAGTNMDIIKQNFLDVEVALRVLPGHVIALQPVRDEYLRYSQYATARENLKHIFTLPETVEKTRGFINDGKLLHAHQSLAEIENSRNDLLLELHRAPNPNPVNQRIVMSYFCDVTELYELLEKQLWLILKRTLNTVRKEPTQIVTALRIVEREEKRDKAALEKQKETGFLPHGRPKHLRQKVKKILEEAVVERVTGGQLESRTESKMWLVRALEISRLLILEDLRVVKSLCTPCFPPNYQILNCYVEMYHNCMRSHLKDIIQSGLQSNEYVTMLSWVLNTYPGPELLKHTDLNLDIVKMDPLLEPELIQKLQQQYLNNVSANYKDWLQNTLDGEIKEWRKPNLPEKNSDGYYHTSAPIIISQMMDQNLQVSKTVSAELTKEMMLVSLDSAIVYGKNYKVQIHSFKSQYFGDRSKVEYFTHYIIAVINNCLQQIELFYVLNDKYLKGVIDNRCRQKFDEVQQVFQTLKTNAMDILLEEAFLDLEPQFSSILSKKWVTSNEMIEVIVVTLEDYFGDYKHLEKKNFESLMIQAETKVVAKYIHSMLQKRMTFKLYDERKMVMDKVTSETNRLKQLFSLVEFPSENCCDVIIALADIVKVKDPEMLSLEAHGLLLRYNDISEEQFTALLSMRGDISKVSIKTLYHDIKSRDNTTEGKTRPRSVMSEVPAF